MPAGRPTKYRKEFCESLIIHMKKGLSFEAFGAECDVSKDTLYQWVSKHPEFADAKKRGTSHSQKFWETIALAGMLGKYGKNFNAAVWIFNMRNRFNWTDKEHPSESNFTINLAYDPKNVVKPNEKKITKSLKGKVTT